MYSRPSFCNNSPKNHPKAQVFFYPNHAKKYAIGTKITADVLSQSREKLRDWDTMSSRLALFW
jgi:hypothetical protein